MRAGQADRRRARPEQRHRRPDGNLQILYAAFRGDGVYLSPNRGQVFEPDGRRRRRPADPGRRPRQPARRSPVTAPGADAQRAPRAGSSWPSRPVPTEQRRPRTSSTRAGSTPLSSRPDGDLDGLYLTKDFGQNWTKVHLDHCRPAVRRDQPSGADERHARARDYDIGDGPAQRPAGQGNYDISLAIDPTNPNVVYLGGTADGQPDAASSGSTPPASTTPTPWRLHGTPRRQRRCSRSTPPAASPRNDPINRPTPTSNFNPSRASLSLHQPDPRPEQLLRRLDGHHHNASRSTTPAPT